MLYVNWQVGVSRNMKNICFGIIKLDKILPDSFAGRGRSKVRHIILLYHFVLNEKLLGRMGMKPDGVMQGRIVSIERIEEEIQLRYNG